MSTGHATRGTVGGRSKTNHPSLNQKGEGGGGGGGGVPKKKGNLRRCVVAIGVLRTKKEEVHY